jgi:hypothetical protein
VKRRAVTRGNREPARANGRIVCQRPDRHEVPQSFYWFPITPKKIRQAARRSALLYPRPFPVDIVVRTSAAHEESLEVGDSFFREIVGKGSVLHERPSRRRVDQECGHLSRMHARALQRLKLEV